MGRWAQAKRRGGGVPPPSCPDFAAPDLADFEVGELATSYTVHIVTPAAGATSYSIQQNLDGGGYTDVGEFPVGDDYTSDPLGPGREVDVRIAWLLPGCPLGPYSDPQVVFT